jgi:hypothetical protein
LREVRSRSITSPIQKDIVSTTIRHSIVLSSSPKVCTDRQSTESSKSPGIYCLRSRFPRLEISCHSTQPWKRHPRSVRHLRVRARVHRWSGCVQRARLEKLQISCERQSYHVVKSGTVNEQERQDLWKSDSRFVIVIRLHNGGDVVKAFLEVFQWRDLRC